MVDSSRMPVIFVGHGNPMNAIFPNAYTDAWRAMAASFPKPKAIVCISAHWYERGTKVTPWRGPGPSTTSEAFRRSYSQ
jgi:4,5-DOPA dioxygenase extradiol